MHDWGELSRKDAVAPFTGAWIEIDGETNG